jgi:nicotinamide-nucleotide amidase
LIAEAVLEAWRRADVVITTGGLGPTEDDRTRETIARALGRSLVLNIEVEKELLKFFQDRGRAPSANNFKQCYLLEGAERLSNPHGTAPGQWLQMDGKVLIMLPGPPNELRPMFENEVLPRMDQRGWLQTDFSYLQIRTTGIGESQLETRLQPVFNRYRDRLEVAYCAHEGLVDLRLSAAVGKMTRDELFAVGESCRQLLGDSFATYGDNCIAALILQQLRSLGRTLAVAESCTGGLLSSHFTDVAGASKVFMGGVVCYRNEAKENILGIPDSLLRQHGAVSPECAVAMASAAAELFESDYALSITGFAGPEGGHEPAGTVYVGYYSPIGVWARRIQHPGTRSAVKVRAVYAALDVIRRKLLKYEVHDLLESMRC